MSMIKIINIYFKKKTISRTLKICNTNLKITLYDEKNTAIAFVIALPLIKA